MYNFEIVKDYTYLGTFLPKINYQRLKIELQMQVEHMMHFFLYERVNQSQSRKNL